MSAETIRQVTDEMMKSFKPRRLRATGPDPAPKKKIKRAGFICEVCKDLGWVYKPGRTEAVPCKCKAPEILARRMARLNKIDGLNDDQRAFRLSDFDGNPNQTTQAGSVSRLLDAGYGQAVLVGPYGTGKTRMMIATVNEAKEKGVQAHYIKMSALLVWLRQSYNKDSDMDFMKRWELLTTIQVLAVDEIEKVKGTEWVKEQIRNLVDDRWVNLRTHLTLYASNAPIENLTEAGMGDVEDRLKDNRAYIIRVDGESLRRVNHG